MAVLGGGMWFLERYGFSAGPLVLGIVLGPIAEQNFVYGYTIATAGEATAIEGALPYFFGGVMNITLIILIILSVAGSVALEIKARRRRAGGEDHV